MHVGSIANCFNYEHVVAMLQCVYGVLCGNGWQLWQ